MGWVDPRYLEPVLLLEWVKANAQSLRAIQALREKKGETVPPCGPCAGVGGTVMVDSEGASYFSPCLPCAGTGSRRASVNQHFIPPGQ